MSEISIYQIRSSLDLDNAKFKGFDVLKTAQVDESIYTMVFKGDVGTKDLDEIYYIFNANLPKEFTGHSLSISDVIEVVDAKDSCFYYCDVIGFKQIEFDRNKINTAQDIKVVIAEYGCKPYEKYVLNDEKAFSLELGGSASERMELKDGICFYCSNEKDKLMFAGVSNYSGNCCSLSINQAQKLKDQFNSKEVAVELDPKSSQINTQMY